MAEIQAIDEPESHNSTLRLIGFLSALLDRLAESNDRRRDLVPEPANSTAFHGVTRPAISIRSYLERIFKYANCSQSCFLVAYVYLDRLAQLQPMIGAVDSFNVHRLLITSVLVAAKFIDDLCYNNAYYAKIGGISTKEMNFLEVEFLFGLGFHLNVTPTTFHGYTCYLHDQMMMIQPTISTVLITPSLPNYNLNPDHHCSSSATSIHHHQDETSSSSHQRQHQQLAV